MKVWSVRLGLGFGEKKVLIHPIKVYWAPLMKDWRIFIQSSSKDLFQPKNNYFLSPSCWFIFVGLQCQWVKVQFQIKRKYWQRFSLTKLNEMKWFAIIELESKVSFSFIDPEMPVSSKSCAVGRSAKWRVDTRKLWTHYSQSQNWKIGTKNGKCFVALNINWYLPFKPELAPSWELNER